MHKIAIPLTDKKVIVGNKADVDVASFASSKLPRGFQPNFAHKRFSFTNPAPNQN